MSYRLTIRHGPRVAHESFDSVDAALDAMERHTEEVVGEGGLGTAQMLREFSPSQRVAARLEISAGGLLRRRDAGVDVMGDGSLLPYTGGIRRRGLDVGDGESAFDAVRRALVS